MIFFPTKLAKSIIRSLQVDIDLWKFDTAQHIATCNTHKIYIEFYHSGRLYQFYYNDIDRSCLTFCDELLLRRFFKPFIFPSLTTTTIAIPNSVDNPEQFI